MELMNPIYFEEFSRRHFTANMFKNVENLDFGETLEITTNPKVEEVKKS